MDSKREGPLPPSGLPRAWLIGSASVQALATKLQHLSLAAFTRDPAKRQALMDRAEEELADLLFGKLVQLRGTGLKLAQILCQDGGILPARFAERFADSFHRAPPVNRVVMRELLLSELGERWNELSEFSWDPVAAASLGQVYRANHRASGKPVAVKVQYPGVDRTVTSDMRLARTILAQIPRTELMLSTMDVLERRLEREVNYEIEAQNISHFRKAYAGPVHVPAALSELGSRRVLVTEWVDAPPLLDWIATNPPAEARARVAQQIFDFYFESIFALGMNHSDPHPGNFLVGLDRLSLVDFGSLETGIPSPVVMLLGRLLWPETPKEALLAAYSSLGAEVGSGDDFWEDVIAPFHAVAAALLGEECVTVTPDLLRQLRLSLTRPALHPGMRGFTAEFTYLHRSLLGTLSLVEKLGVPVASVGAREQLAKSRQHF